MAELAEAMRALPQLEEALARAGAKLAMRKRASEAARGAAKELRADATPVERQAIQAEVKETADRVKETERAKREVVAAHADAQQQLDVALAADFALRGCGEEWTELHQSGLVRVEASAHDVRVDPVATRRDTKFEPIFNEPVEKGKGKWSHRLQGRAARGGGESAEVLSFERQVTRFLDQRGWRRTVSGVGTDAFKRVKDGYALHSVVDCKDAMPFGGAKGRCKCGAGCKAQSWHADSTKAGAYRDSGVPLGNVPLVVLQATQDDTPFHFQPFGGERQTITLQANDLVIFRGARPQEWSPLCTQPLTTRTATPDHR